MSTSRGRKCRQDYAEQHRQAQLPKAGHTSFGRCRNLHRPLICSRPNPDLFPSRRLVKSFAHDIHPTRVHSLREPLADVSSTASGWNWFHTLPGEWLSVKGESRKVESLQSIFPAAHQGARQASGTAKRQSRRGHFLLRKAALERLVSPLPRAGARASSEE